MKKLITITLLAGLAGSASASVWTGLGGDNLWDNAGNWDAGVPASGVAADIDNAAVVLNNAAWHQADGLAVGANNTTSLTIQNGSTIQTGVGGGNWAWIGGGGGLSGAGTLVLDAGTGFHASALVVGSGGYGTVVNSGDVHVWGDFYLDAWSAAAGHLQLNDGSFQVDGAIAAWGGAATMDLADGTFLVNGDQVASLTTWINGGSITANGGPSTIADFNLDYNTTNAGFTTLSVIPEPATLGLVAAFGGALLMIRRKLMI